MYFIFYFSFFIISVNCDDTFDKLWGNININLFEVVQDIIKYSKNNFTDLNLSDNCMNSLTNMYLLDINKDIILLSLKKLIYDSSKNQNDVTTYYDCIKKKNGSLFTYIMTSFDKRNNVTSIFEADGVSMIVFGVCVVKGCNKKEYKDIIFREMELLNSSVLKKDEMNVYDLSDNDMEWNFQIKNIIFLIPAFIIVIQIIFTLWTTIPSLILKCFLMCNHKKLLKGDIKKEKELHKISLISNFVKTAFTLGKNSEELFDFSPPSNTLNKDQGLSYIKAVRGVFLIFMILGETFFGLNNYPLVLKSNEEFVEILKSMNFWIFYTGLKYSPRILLSCSGYSLFYKLMCFLDDRYEEEKEKSILLQQNNKNCNFIVSFSQSSLDDRNYSQVNDGILSSEHYLLSPELSRHKLITIKYLFQFILYQIHKYINTLIVIVFIRYSLYYIVLAFKDFGPMWGFFKKNIIECTTSIELIMSFFSIHGYYFPKGGMDTFLNYFWLVFNEILGFTFTSIIIFFGYKNNWRLDRIFIFSAFLIFIIKTFIYFFNVYGKNTNVINPFTASDYLNYLKFGKFSIDFIFNYIYYIIGCYFSMINYSLQKGYSFELAENHNKNYLFVPIKFSKKFQRLAKNHKILMNILGVLLIILLFSFCEINHIIFSIISIRKDNPKDIINYYYYIKWPGIILFYDIDFVILIIHGIYLLFYYLGNTMLSKYYTFALWSILDKIYFSFILLFTPISLYLLYQSETKISLTIPKALLYSLICGFLSLIISSIYYIIFDIPYKKVIHYLYSNH